MSSTQGLKKLAPRPSGDGNQPPNLPGYKVKKRARQLVSAACVPCQRRKCKCDGARPVCSSCRLRAVDCEYNITAGVSRHQDLKLKNQNLVEHVEGLEAIINALRGGRDNEAAAVLARLRLGDRVEDIVQSLEPTRLPLRPSITPNAIADVSQPTVSHSRTSFIRDALSSPTEDLPFSPTLGRTNAMLAEPPLRFISPLFDRRDWLQVSGPKQQDEGLESESVEFGAYLQTVTTAASAIQPAARREHPITASTGSSIEISQTVSETWGVQTTKTSVIHSKAPFYVSHHQMIPQVNIFPDLKNFGNLPFSSGIRANNYPADVQERQVENLFVPSWAMMTVNTRPGARSVKEPINNIYEEAKKLLEAGVPISDVIGVHLNVGAIFDPAEFSRAPMLSQWAARMAYSIKHDNYNFTVFASMYMFWYVMRWMLDPRPETYEAIPSWLRPMPNQLFIPHVEIVDFLIWPTLREHVIKVPSLQVNLEWMMDMSLTATCAWEATAEKALCRNAITGDFDLTDAAKECIHTLHNWYVTPSFRKYMTNADDYVRIKWDDN